MSTVHIATIIWTVNLEKIIIFLVSNSRKHLSGQIQRVNPGDLRLYFFNWTKWKIWTSSNRLILILIDEIHMFMKARRNFVEPETYSKNKFQFFEIAASCKNSYKDPESGVMFTLCLPNMSQMYENDQNQLHKAHLELLRLTKRTFFDTEKPWFCRGKSPLKFVLPLHSLTSLKSNFGTLIR